MDERRGMVVNEKEDRESKRVWPTFHLLLWSEELKHDKEFEKEV